MLKLNDIAKICAGLALGKDVNPFIDKFEVRAELPFLFYDALQREMVEMAMNVGALKPDFAQHTQFIDISFPNGILIHISPGDRILFEVVNKEIPPLPFNNGSFLKPGGDRN